MIWSSVLLPAPFLPMTPNVPPRGTENETSCNATTESGESSAASGDDLPKPRASQCRIDPVRLLKVLDDRLQGREAWFPAPVAQGLRLVYVQPLANDGARVGAIAVERPLPSIEDYGTETSSLQGADEDAFRIPTRLAPSTRTRVFFRPANRKTNRSVWTRRASRWRWRVASCAPVPLCNSCRPTPDGSPACWRSSMLRWAAPAQTGSSSRPKAQGSSSARASRTIRSTRGFGC